MRLLAGHLGWSRADRILDLGAGPAHVSLRIAPFVGEVIVMDPEAAMIEEGRRRSAASGVGNLSFVVGGSDDLPRLSSERGPLSGVVISQAFHWMADQDAVLRVLDELVERDRGAVALVGYVKATDNHPSWLERAPWSSVGENCATTSRGHRRGTAPRRSPRPVSGDPPAVRVPARGAPVVRARRGDPAIGRSRDRPLLLAEQSPHPPRCTTCCVRVRGARRARRCRHRPFDRATRRQRPRRPPLSVVAGPSKDRLPRSRRRPRGRRARAHRRRRHLGRDRMQAQPRTSRPHRRCRPPPAPSPLRTGRRSPFLRGHRR
jgi:SAM-dependent methyltransferase